MYSLKSQNKIVGSNATELDTDVTVSFYDYLQDW